MLPARVLDLVGSLARATLRRCRRSADLFPGLLRDRARLLRWIAAAWLGHLCLIGTAAFLLLALPKLLDETIPRLYPDVVAEKKILGFLPRRDRAANPLREERRRQATALFWAGGTCFVLFAFWLQVPAPPGTTARSAARRDDETIREPRVTRGEVGDRYDLEEQLARGGMGTVWRAVDRVLDRPVALKELPLALTADEDAVRRFRAEARSLARLVHPNVVQVYDLVERGDRIWMVMELIEGGDLSARIRSEGRLEGADASRIAAPVAEALHFAHEQGIVHRDVKPANVLLTDAGVPKLADFGVARLASSGATMTGAVIGSPRYMSPEQAAGGAADERSDVYSLGVTLWEMLTGTPPFEGEAVAVLARHVNETPQRPSERGAEVPAEMEDLVMEMLAKDPDDRPQDMGEVAERLRSAASS
ncbi:MAG: serine/threonine-protein kinase [Candidatus Eiseniibacteriota bacterium]